MESMSSDMRAWVEDVAVEFGFRRLAVEPLEAGDDPNELCRFRVLGVVYLVEDGAISVESQER